MNAALNVQVSRARELVIGHLALCTVMFLLCDVGCLRAYENRILSEYLGAKGMRVGVENCFTKRNFIVCTVFLIWSVFLNLQGAGM